jgi:glycosyltransferase involved in cell wall biosynthesis
LKPSVLHIIDSFEQGGTERQALQLVRLLDASGQYRVHLACLQNRGPLRAEAERLGLGEIHAYPLNNFYDRNFVRQLRRLKRFLKEREIKVVHTHDFYTNIFGMIGAATARVSARIASKRETEGFRSPLQKRIERGAYRLSHRVVANAEAVRQQLIREGVRAEKIVTLYNGLDMQRVAPTPGLGRDEALALFNLPHEPSRRFITIVANLRHAVKDHPTFLRAAARVHAACPEAAFVIAGEGELLESLRALAADLGLGASVFFIGRCERVADLLSVSSSQAEGFSNSILEYMAAGRPVVVTDVGGAREAVVEGESGYLVPARSDELMAARLIELLRERERAEAMGSYGRRVVEEKFSCEAQLERTLALYDSLLARPAVAHGQGAESVVRRERA